jgi:NAD(P)-dependent dehydrogenase (short-subunit alcohol dehydrogenase family)
MDVGMGKLKGKVAIVTGSTSGMGKGIAERFAREGAAVVVNGRNEAPGNDVVAAIRDAGGRAVFVISDVSVFEGNQLLVNTAIEKFGGLDIVVPNAGLLGNGSVTELPLETWHKAIDTNLSAAFYLIKLAIPEMQKRGGGVILVNGSIAAWKEFPNHPAYCASKAALVALVKQVALDYGPTIRANILCPGQVDTPLLWESTKAFPNPEEIVAQVVEEHLVMKRLGTPEDIANAALFLASDDASWITGSALVVDGGRLLGG